MLSTTIMGLAGLAAANGPITPSCDLGGVGYLYPKYGYKGSEQKIHFGCQDIVDLAVVHSYNLCYNDMVQARCFSIVGKTAKEK